MVDGPVRLRLMTQGEQAKGTVTAGPGDDGEPVNV